MPSIEIKTQILAAPPIVFDLARSIDLHQRSTKQTKEVAIGGVTSGLIGLNESVTWRAKHFGIYQELTAIITAFEKPHYFVDEMLAGAFKAFRHEHIFQATQTGTLMIDIFDFQSPLGYLGKVADYLFLSSYMRNLLEKRNLMIKAYAESDRWKDILPTH